MLAGLHLAICLILGRLQARLFSLRILIVAALSCYCESPCCLIINQTLNTHTHTKLNKLPGPPPHRQNHVHGWCLEAHSSSVQSNHNWFGNSPRAQAAAATGASGWWIAVRTISPPSRSPPHAQLYIMMFVPYFWSFFYKHHIIRAFHHS